MRINLPRMRESASASCWNFTLWPFDKGLDVSHQPRDETVWIELHQSGRDFLYADKYNGGLGLMPSCLSNNAFEMNRPQQRRKLVPMPAVPRLQ